jgi:hypothetical protein
MGQPTEGALLVAAMKVRILNTVITVKVFYQNNRNISPTKVVTQF